MVIEPQFGVHGEHRGHSILSQNSLVRRQKHNKSIAGGTLISGESRRKSKSKVQKKKKRGSEGYCGR